MVTGKTCLGLFYTNIDRLLESVTNISKNIPLMNNKVISVIPPHTLELRAYLMRGQKNGILSYFFHILCNLLSEWVDTGINNLKIFTCLDSLRDVNHS